MLYASLKCTQNWHLVSAIITLDIAFVILFVDFYRKAYNKTKQKSGKGISKKNNAKIYSRRFLLPVKNAEEKKPILNLEVFYVSDIKVFGKITRKDNISETIASINDFGREIYQGIDQIEKAERREAKKNL